MMEEKLTALDNLDSFDSKSRKINGTANLGITFRIHFNWHCIVD